MAEGRVASAVAAQDHLMNEKAEVVRVCLPPDANCLLSVADHCLRSRHYVNVVDPMKLQPQTEHPHGLSDMDFDGLFTMDKPGIFAFQACPWLNHRLTYRRTNHDDIHVRGYKEEGTSTTPFDLTVLNDLDRFHLAPDTIDRLPQTGDKGISLKQQLKDKLIEHRESIDNNDEDLPEIRNWNWRKI